MNQTTRLEVSVAEQAYKEKVRRRLLDTGWRHVSSGRDDNFSGWSKQLPDGFVLLVQESLALATQGYIEEQEELGKLRWICRKCTTVNGVDNQTCLGCKAEKPERNPPATSQSFEQLRQFIEVNADGAIFVKAEFSGGTAIDEWIRLAVDWFRQNGGNNYVLMDLCDARDGQEYAFKVQRKSGRTPSQSIAELSAEQPRIVNRILRTLEKLQEFYTQEQAIIWLEQSHRDLQNRRPADVLLTQEGQYEVSAILARMADGAHS